MITVIPGKITRLCILLVVLSSPVLLAERFAGYEDVVSETHRASIAAREKTLNATLAKNSYWIKGRWGETIWSLAALYSNEKTDAANAILLKNSTVYANAMKADATAKEFRPEKRSPLTPWAYFALTDYVRILCLFRAGSDHCPGRLEPETEAAMKEALWWLVKSRSKVAEASLDDLLVHHGTENHDLTLRPSYYLVASVLKDDPAYKERRYDDGHTAAEHYAAYNAYFREWPRKRAMIGMWFEMGSNTYQKYSWPALFNLHELSPDAVVRKRFGMLLDIAFIEEAQVSLRGRRGGGRSRAGYGRNSFESYKNLFYAPEEGSAGCSHSKVMETSSYQLPVAAILLRKMAFPAEEPFIIANRVPGELALGGDKSLREDGRNAYVSDSALINYAYRTPHYLLGSTLQNPALSMPSNGGDVLKYSGGSRQNRWSGMLFCDPASDDVCAVYPAVEKTRGGRPQHPHWSFQHENVLFLQRIQTSKAKGSYSTGRISIRFHGRDLEKVEEGGWIFASNGKAFVAVRFIDGDHEWDNARELASPVEHDRSSTTRVLIHAGDIGHTTFEQFRRRVAANELIVESNRVEYRPTAGGSRLECFRYDVSRYKEFKLPQIDGNPIQLRPEWTYRSPYLNGQFGDDKIAVTVGPIKHIYDFGDSSVLDEGGAL